MHLKNYNLKILERGPDICINFTSTESWNAAKVVVYGGQESVQPAASPAIQLPPALCFQDFTHVSPSVSPGSLVSQLPQFPFLIYKFPTHFLKWCLLDLTVHTKKLEHLKKSHSQYSPSQRFRLSALEWGATRAFFISCHSCPL